MIEVILVTLGFAAVFYSIVGLLWLQEKILN